MIQKAIDAYRDGGAAALGRKLRYGYCHVVETYLRPYAPKRERIVRLNGVEVPVDRSIVDAAPFFEPALPTADNAHYEREEVAAIRTYVRAGDHVVIIGGGVGVTAVTAARVVGAEGRVTVYEPSDVALDVARRTVAWNDCADRVDLVHAAVGTPQKSCFTYRMQRRVTSLPYRDLPDADVFEMDCEGEERAILENMSATPRVVLVETHGNHDAVVQCLRDRGYAIDDVVDLRPTDGLEANDDRTHVRAVRDD